MTVKIYSTPTCPWCDRLKHYLTTKNVSFVEIDVSTDRDSATEMSNKSGQRGVPVIDINGSIVVGFNQEKIDKLLSE